MSRPSVATSSASGSSSGIVDLVEDLHVGAAAVAGLGLHRVGLALDDAVADAAGRAAQHAFDAHHVPHACRTASRCRSACCAPWASRPRSSSSARCRRPGRRRPRPASGRRRPASPPAARNAPAAPAATSTRWASVVRSALRPRAPPRPSPRRSSGEAARTAWMAAAVSAGTCAWPQAGRAGGRWSAAPSSSGSNAAREIGGMPCSSACPMRSNDGSAGVRQVLRDLVLGARQPREERQIGRQLVPGRQGGQPLGAVEEQRRRIGEDGERRLRLLADIHQPSLGAPTSDTSTSNRGSRLCDCRRLFRRSFRRLFLDLAFVHFLAQPLAVVPPAPAAGHRAARHGADRATHPDRRIDVDDPDGDRQHGRADAWISAAQRFCSMVALKPSRFSK